MAEMNLGTVVLRYEAIDENVKLLVVSSYTFLLLPKNY